MKFGLNETTIRKIQRVFANYPQIEQVLIYGSRARDTYREGSDIDLTLIGKELTERTCSDVWLDIDDLNTPYLYDISVFHLLKSDSLIDHINRVGSLC
jgi:predicted nucleotidyltransferase